EGRTPKEKHPFLFQKKFHPRQIRNARSVFSFGVAEALRGSGGTIHSRSKKVRANDIMTPQALRKSPFMAVFSLWKAQVYFCFAEQRQKYRAGVARNFRQEIYL
ncbi:MAG: hypothetical protein Q7S19_01605, partial [bacterium]|nr:hypothetical protein [bacterium]